MEEKSRAQELSVREISLIRELTQIRKEHKRELEYEKFDGYELPPRTQFSMLNKPAVSIKYGVMKFNMACICILQRKDRQSIAITPCAAEHPMSFKVPDRLLTDGQCRMRINGVQFVQALLEANGLAAGKDYQFKGRYEAEKNAVIISLEKDEREC